MNNRITYYSCRFTQTAPLRLSAGENSKTDSDLMLDGRGLPMIPGSSIAGVLRAMLDRNSAVELFGAEKGDSDNEAESRVILSDALLPKDAKFSITVRDGVGINERGTALEGAKYNFQVVESASPFTAIFELSHGDNDNAYMLLKSLMERIAANGASFGARTTRGYGFMKMEAIEKTFILPDEIDAWLDFDPFVPNAFSDGTPVTGAEAKNGNSIRAGMRIDGNFIVRIYSSDVGAPDFTPLKSVNMRPVIPGTSWAGAFRHHMLQLADSTGRPGLKRRIDRLFGVPCNTVDRDELMDSFESEEDKRALESMLESLIGASGNQVRVAELLKFARDTRQEGLASRINAMFGIIRSPIEFMETEVVGGSPVDVTRVALDRFTMAPKKSALFTSTVWNGGSGVLEIRINDSGSLDKELMELLHASLLDLHLGILTFGGSAAVGYGRARLTSLEIGQQKTNSLCDVQLFDEGGPEQ